MGSRVLAVIPYIDLFDMTMAAAQDVLTQSLRPKLLLIDNGSEERVSPWREALCWRHDPPLPTLAATWNTAFRFARGAGYSAVWMLNNDLRLHARTLEFLAAAMQASGALFVSAVGRGPDCPIDYDIAAAVHNTGKGGPDYSCFLMSIECWKKYPFDEAFTYAGDLDHHRRIMLGGDGGRIFSLNIPYLHFGSATIKHRPDLAVVADLHRAHYERKWGGQPANEKWNEPYGGAPPRDGACTTTPDLQQHRCAGFHRDDGTLLDPGDLAAAICKREVEAAEACAAISRARR